MRTGEDYREALRDGRQVIVLGDGPVADVTTHRATKDMVDSYAAWYDRHSDPEWRDLLWTQKAGTARPIAFEIPQSADDLKRLGRAIAAVSFTTGGNMTHTPGYGALIALGLLDTLKAMNLSAEEIANCKAYRNEVARTGRFLTFSAGGAPIGFRYRENESDRAAIQVIKERDDGVIISGKVSMHTSSPFADDVFVSGGTKRKPGSPNFSWFIIPVAAPGVRVITRKPAARHGEASVAPMAHRYDELDAQLWLENVFIPWERVFTAETPLGFGKSAPKDGGAPRTSNLAAWLFWHQQLGWLAKLEFTLGLALAAAEVMGYKENPAAVDQLLDMVIDVQTARTCMAAAAADPEMSDGGFLMPGQLHIASASLYTLRVRQRITEAARRLPGSSLVVAPALSDFDDPAIARDLEEAFGGGAYSAKQRAALLNLIWDHVSSGLDGRESTYEMHANGGVAAWRMRMRGGFKSYNDLANGVLKALDIEMPRLDVSSIGAPTMPRGLVPGAPVSQSASAKADPSADLRAAGQWLGSPSEEKKK